MSETTTMLKVASCDLVLRMIEEGVVMRDLTMENPIRAIREISHDVTGRRKVRLANGREASALEIQGEYLAKARDFVDRREISTPIIEQALDLWERGLKAVESDDLGLVDREIDWVIKWKLIDALPRQARPAARATRGSPSSTSPTTTSTAAAASTTCSRSAARSPG